jgi:cytidine deaminase
MIDQSTAQSLLHSAKLAAENAYAPYSHFPVGAALLTADGNVLTGVNVENVSYGLTLCAERCALVKAVSEGCRKFQAIAVWATQRSYGSVTPCGACRQVLAEFLSPDAVIVMSDAETGALKMLTMAALLPEAFGSVPGENCLDTGSN